jgi:hypothetical protein
MAAAVAGMISSTISDDEQRSDAATGGGGGRERRRGAEEGVGRTGAVLGAIGIGLDGGKGKRAVSTSAGFELLSVISLKADSAPSATDVVASGERLPSIVEAAESGCTSLWCAFPFASATMASGS